MYRDLSYFKNLAILSSVVVLLSADCVHGMNNNNQNNNNQNNNNQNNNNQDNKHPAIRQKNPGASAATPTDSSAKSAPAAAKPVAASSKDVSAPKFVEDVNPAVKYVKSDEEARQDLENFLDTQHPDLSVDDRNALAPYIVKLISPAAHRDANAETLGYLVSSVVWFVPSPNRDEYIEFINALLPVDPKVDLDTRLRATANVTRGFMNPLFKDQINIETQGMTPNERASFLADFDFYPTGGDSGLCEHELGPDEYIE